MPQNVLISEIHQFLNSFNSKENLEKPEYGISESRYLIYDRLFRDIIGVDDENYSGVGATHLGVKIDDNKLIFDRMQIEREKYNINVELSSEELFYFASNTLYQGCWIFRNYIIKFVEKLKEFSLLEFEEIEVKQIYDNLLPEIEMELKDYIFRFKPNNPEFLEAGFKYICKYYIYIWIKLEKNEISIFDIIANNGFAIASDLIFNDKVFQIFVNFLKFVNEENTKNMNYEDIIPDVWIKILGLYSDYFRQKYWRYFTENGIEETMLTKLTNVAKIKGYDY